MCGIFGALVSKANVSTHESLSQLLQGSKYRGRDGYGYSGFTSSQTIFRHTSSERSQAVIWPHHEQYSLIGTCRGEPTSERVDRTKDENIPPFISPSGSWIIAHNGVIANDKQLCQEHNWTPYSPIDTCVIGYCLDEFGFERTIKDLLVGSFAILAINQADPNMMYFASNYRPLFLQRSLTGNIIRFASQASFFSGGLGTVSWLLKTVQLDDFESIYELSPYKWGSVTTDGRMIIRRLTSKEDGLRPKRVLVVCSGGLDSSTAAWETAKKQREVDLLHFRYSCKAEQQEVLAVYKLAKVIRCKVHEVDVSFFKNFAPSVLTDEKRKVNKAHGGESGMEFAHEWVPARNLIMLSLAVAFAEAHDYDVVMLGGNQEEAGAFPDNEDEFINKFNAILPYAVKPYKQISIQNPYGGLMKHDIVKRGLDLQMPYELTWSCYEGGSEPCGQCGPCFMAQRAFEMNGATHPRYTNRALV